MYIKPHAQFFLKHFINEASQVEPSPTRNGKIRPVAVEIVYVLSISADQLY